jgi:hypothetical protein
VLPSVVCVGLGVLWRHWSVRSSAVVPEEVAGPPEGRATGELVSATEAHVGRRASIQAGVVLLQGMQEAMDNEDIYSVSSSSSDGDKWPFSDNNNLSVSDDDEEWTREYIEMIFFVLWYFFGNAMSAPSVLFVVKHVQLGVQWFQPAQS